jgi:hypothetical protein
MNLKEKNLILTSKQKIITEQPIEIVIITLVIK